MNLTDVDDKTIKGSQKQQTPLRQYTEYYAKAFFEDATALNIKPASHYPRATEHIPEMVTLIKTLISKGYAYKGEDDSTYYAISKFKNYGQLSKIKIQETSKQALESKLTNTPKKKHRTSPSGKLGQPKTVMSAGKPNLAKDDPGWHIECSAMSMKYLGETFDIHCGGVDNMFPHHENEIAQSEAATGKRFVNYWLHNEHLLVEGKRMAKRYGNFYTLRDLLKMGHDPKAIRYLLLSTHYRQQFNFTFEGLEAAKGAIDRLTNLMRRLLDADGKSSKEKIDQLIAKVQTSFGEAMDDDLNISVALAALFDFVREINNLLDANALSKEEAKEVYTLMAGFDKVLGVIGEVKREETLPKEAAELINQREEARKAKDWKTADAIRQQLKAMGIVIEDTAQGVRWKIEKA